MRFVGRILVILGAAAAVALGGGSTSASTIEEIEGPRIENPRGGAILASAVPVIRICIGGHTGAEKPPGVRATLDGADITGEIRWSGECGAWRASDADWRKAVPRPGRPAPVDFDAWQWRLSEGRHTLEVVGPDPSGNEVRKSARFEVRTRRHFTGLDLGIPDVSLIGFQEPFAPLGSLDLRLGHVRWWEDAGRKGLVSYGSSFLSVGAASSALAGGGGSGDIGTTFWKGAAGRRRAYGYRIGDNRFVAPYHGTSAFFGELSVDGPVTNPDDASEISPFDGHTRVGTSFEGGVHFQIGPSFGFDVGYEQTAVYPHWLFWKALGSGAIHGLALCGTDKIAAEIAKVSPRTAPIFAFLVKNAISYALYHQRKGEVNWPFSSGDALFYEGVKLNFAFSY